MKLWVIAAWIAVFILLGTVASCAYTEEEFSDEGNRTFTFSELRKENYEPPKPAAE